MKLRLILLLIVIIVSLSAQFSDFIKINEDIGSVQYRGDEACKVVGDEIYLTFVSSYLYFSYSNDCINFTTQIIADNIYIEQFSKPSLEIMPDGRIIIFFIKEIDDVCTLMKATSINNGSSFEIENIETNVTSFATCLDGDELYLTYNKEDIVNLSYYQHFTQYEETENSSEQPDVTVFKGLDVLEGPVHSNDDIWIQNALGGWPTFHGFVTTSKRIRIWPSGELAIYNAPIEQIFLGGIAEQLQAINLPSTADTLSSNATIIGAEQDIVYVKMDGSFMQTMYGDIIETGVQLIDVYSWFPHDSYNANMIVNNGSNWFEESDLIWTNYVMICDTIWTVGPTLPITLEGSSYFVPDAELWIEGEVRGKVTWGCGNNVYLVGDISYSNTNLGEAPDDPDNLNMTDYFGLVSEEKILIRYKHRDPFLQNVLRDDNCDDIYLYGAYAALGKGDSLIYGNKSCHYDGVFTYEYQHPHGSTPNFEALSPYNTSLDTLYTHVDLHKYVFPPSSVLPPGLEGFNLHGGNPQNNGTCGFPYESEEYLNSYPNSNPDDYINPYGTDYPWYNPVWPESSDDIVFERGTVNLWGSMIQRRRGFIHRSGSDDYNHPLENNEWDLDDFHYGGDHPSTGYYKNYHYDSRLIDEPLTNFPTTEVIDSNSKVIIARSVDYGNNFEIITYTTVEDYDQVMSIVADGDLIGAVIWRFALNDILFSTNHGLVFTNQEISSFSGFIRSMEVSNEMIYFYLTSIYLYEFNPITMEFSMYHEFFPAGYISNFAISNNQQKIYADLRPIYPNEINIDFLYTEDSGSNFNQIYNWQTSNIYNPYPYSRLYINFNQQDYVHLSFLHVNEYYPNDLYFAKGSLPNLTGIEENQVPQNKKITLSNYPNPFNPETNLVFNLPEESKVELYIYNIKGQKIRSLLSDQISAGKHSVIWDGEDTSGKKVGSGIYLYKLNVNGKTEAVKKCLLLK